MKQYDVIIGGAGLTGAVLANLAVSSGKSVMVVEREKIGGLCRDDLGYSEFGPHIFHTSDRGLWNWVQRFSDMVPTHYSPLVRYKDEMYSFPINLLTLHQLGADPSKLRFESRGKNFEEACVYMVGSTIYEKFFYHYTKKMWGVEPRELPASILKRIPIRLDYNTSYYNDRYVGVPELGYSRMIRSMLDGVEVVTGDFIKELPELRKSGKYLIFTGHVDELFDFKHGEIPYRGLAFEKTPGDRDAPAINYTDDRMITRRVSYKYFGYNDVQIIETPNEVMRYYPVPWGTMIWDRYLSEAKKEGIILAGRLGAYKYFDMNIAIEEAVALWQRLMIDVL